MNPEQAKRLKLNVSQVFEAGLTEAIRQHQREECLRKILAVIRQPMAPPKPTKRRRIGFVQSD